MSKDDAPPGSEAYYEYTIEPVDMREGGHWLTAGIIRKEFEDGVREHRFVRGDRHGDKVIARNYAITKGQQIIDLEGDRLFEQD
ncbi:MAG: HlyU family transcriptional regulator [Alphaproteobacteria bacterium]